MTSARLPEQLLAQLHDGIMAILVSCGDDGYPATTFTWALATSHDRMEVVVDVGSATERRLTRDPRAALQLIGQGNQVFLVRGTLRRVRGPLPDLPFEFAHYALSVEDVSDQAWPGVTVAPLDYRWDARLAADMQAMEQTLFAALRRGSR